MLSDRAVSIRRALEGAVAAGELASLRVSPADSLPDALAAARSADVVLACGGGTTTEQEDRPSLRLDAHDFLSALGAALAVEAPGTPLVVAAMMPGQVVTRPWSDTAHAVVGVFLAGQETGNAWADVLLGRVNPSGKLPVTILSSEEDEIQPCTRRAPRLRLSGAPRPAPSPSRSHSRGDVSPALRPRPHSGPAPTHAPAPLTHAHARTRSTRSLARTLASSFAQRPVPVRRGRPLGLAQAHRPTRRLRLWPRPLLYAILVLVGIIPARRSRHPSRKPQPRRQSDERGRPPWC